MTLEYSRSTIVDNKHTILDMERFSDICSECITAFSCSREPYITIKLSDSIKFFRAKVDLGKVFVNFSEVRRFLLCTVITATIN